MKRIVILFLIISGVICAREAYSQNQASIDSVRSEIEQASHDSVKARLLNDLAELYMSNNPEQAYEYASKALGIAEELNLMGIVSNSLNNIGICFYYNGDYAEALHYYMEAVSVRQELNDLNSLAISYNNIGALYSALGNYAKSLEFFFKSLELAQKDLKLQARNYNNIGIIYYYMEDFDKALECWSKSVSMKVESGDKNGIANTYNNIGDVYRNRGDYQTALKYFMESLAICDELTDTRGTSRAYNNIGLTYQLLKDFVKAEEYLLKSLAIKEDQSNKIGLALVTYNLGDVYLDMDKEKKAFEFLESSIAMAIEIDAKDILKDIYKTYTEYFEKKGNIESAYKYFKLSTSLKDSIFNREKTEKLSDYQIQYETLEKEKEIALLNKDRLIQDFEINESKERIRIQNTIILAFVIGLIIIIGFSVLVFVQFKQKKKVNKTLELRNTEISHRNEEISQQNEEIQSIAEKLELVNAELDKQSMVARQTDNAVMIIDPTGKFEWVNECLLRKYEYSFQELTESDKGNILQYSAHPEIEQIWKDCLKQKETVIYESLTHTKKGKQIWTQTTLTPIFDNLGEVSKLIAIDSDITKLKLAEEEINKKSELLNKKNIQITDSIDYAKRIQEALLPPLSKIKSRIPESFIFYEPRDIVSGDFYWYAELSGKLFVAVVDCTGHGVPGAFMSIVGSNLLDDIICDKQILELPDILEKLHYRLIKLLNSGDPDSIQDDGMELSICCIDKKEQTIELASANQTIYATVDNELRIIRGDVFSIGEKLRQGNEPVFTSTKMPLTKGTNIYMFSDGYQDQFGGPDNMKFMASRFRSLLFEHHLLPMHEQGVKLAETFHSWKKDQKQIDDVLVVGLTLDESIITGA